MAAQRSFQRNIMVYLAEIAYICIVSAKYTKMGEKIIGRKSEVLLLNQLIASPKAEFVAIYGRRRIGKRIW